MTGDKQDVAPAGYCGFGTAEGKRRFPVPETLDMGQLIGVPANWGPGEAATVVMLACNFVLGACAWWVPVWVYVVNFAFWRASYNVLIGVILWRQSASGGFDRWLRSRSPKWQAELTGAATRNVRRDLARAGDDQPPLDPQFESWMVFRLLATMILANDGTSYAMLVWRLLTGPQPDESTAAFAACVAVGLAMCFIGYLAKKDAHDTVGDFAWYWGDFWFRMEGELTFDGVFELVPHPMYTVGYAFYYGLSLITRSHLLLVISLVAHAAQMIFLFLVEEPHIQKMYGPSKPAAEAAEPTPQRSELVGLINLFPLRHADLTLVLLVGQSVLMAVWFDLGDPYYLWQLAMWRAIHWVGLGGALVLQARNGTWTKAFAARGYTELEAYTQFRRIYNMSSVMNGVAFTVVALRWGELPFWSAEDLSSAESWSHLLTGVLLVALSAFVADSVRSSLGEDAQFYADFFIGDTASSPVYTGLYRYMDNPKCVFGHLGQYGAALLLGSWPLFWIALASQCVDYAFVQLVEVPHMRRCYEGLRGPVGLEKLLRQRVGAPVAPPSEDLKKAT